MVEVTVSKTYAESGVDLEQVEQTRYSSAGLALQGSSGSVGPFVVSLQGHTRWLLTFSLRVSHRTYFDRSEWVLES